MITEPFVPCFHTDKIGGLRKFELTDVLPIYTNMTDTELMELSENLTTFGVRTPIAALELFCDMDNVYAVEDENRKICAMIYMMPVSKATVNIGMFLGKDFKKNGAKFLRIAKRHFEYLNKHFKYAETFGIKRDNCHHEKFLRFFGFDEIRRYPLRGNTLMQYIKVL